MRLLLICLLPLVLLSDDNREQSTVVHSAIPSPLYTQVEPHRDGIGKVFMGREISRIMGHQAAGWSGLSGRGKSVRIWQ